MVRSCCLSLLLLTGIALGHAQTALHHYGQMRLHGDTLAMYTSFINDGEFEQKEGTVVFYGDAPMRIAGSLAPQFKDVAIIRDRSIAVEQSLFILNKLDFQRGDFSTDRSLPENSVTLLQNAFTTGEGTSSKVDGYVTAINKQRIEFPVGDSLQYRPLTLEGDIFPISSCAYFREDPNNPSTFPPFLTNIRERNIKEVSRAEFWQLRGSSSGRVSLEWNSASNIRDIAAGVSEIVLVGWSKSSRQWVSLGTLATSGNLEAGLAVSRPFVPDQYEVLTFGSLLEPTELLKLDNYFLSPNGDGVNDVLIIEQLIQSPNNTLQIYDRRGLKVFEMDNYTDEFSGVSNVDSLVLNAEKGLPEGIYFYLVRLHDLGLEFQGFLFLDR